MGKMYMTKSIALLQAEVKSGSIEAQNALAMLHELGLIPDASAQEAARLYAKSAKAGDPLAALYTAVLLDQGADGLAANPGLATGYFHMAERGGFRQAKERLAAIGLGQKRAVLLVGNTPTLRIETHTLLQKKGFAVTEAHDAAEAIRILQSGRAFDLVLSDVEMPTMSGVDLLQVIRTRLKLKDLPVVMLTSVREVELLKKARSFGVQGWVLKPYEADVLIQIVRKALLD